MTNIKLVERPSDGSVWSDTGLTFGPTDNIPNDRSARPVLIPDGIGMVYTAHAGNYWAYRLNGWPVDTPWIEETLFTNSPPYDPSLFRSHFNLVADANRNLHLTMVEHGRLLYFRYLSWRKAWSRPKVLTPNINATYSQITLTQGLVNILVNVQRNVMVFQSANAGKTFDWSYLLTNDEPLNPESGPKMESPAFSFDSIPVFQQYVDNGIQKLLYFEVPAAPPPAQQE